MGQNHSTNFNLARPTSAWKVVFWVAADAAIMPSHTRTLIAGQLRSAGGFLYVKMQENQPERLQNKNLY